MSNNRDKYCEVVIEFWENGVPGADTLTKTSGPFRYREDAEGFAVEAIKRFSVASTKIVPVAGDLE